LMLYITCYIMFTSTKGTEQNKMSKLIAKIRNNEFEAKEEGGKFFAWIPRANHGAGEWQRVAKTKIKKIA